MTATRLTAADGGLEALSADECRHLLALAAIGRLAFVADGSPMILPINYRLIDDGGVWILLRTRPGNTIDSSSERVAFEIDGIDYDHREGWSVLVRGNLQHLDHNQIELFNKRFNPEPWPQQERTSWLALKAETITGKRLKRSEADWAIPSMTRQDST